MFSCFSSSGTEDAVDIVKTELTDEQVNDSGQEQEKVKIPHTSPSSRVASIVEENLSPIGQS